MISQLISGIRQKRTLKKAYGAVFEELKEKGLHPWMIKNPSGEYGMGVVLNWAPDMDEEQKRKALQDEPQTVASAVERIAQQTGLEGVVSDKTLAAGGAAVVYIGLGYSKN